jgi:hypothetical protein
MSTVVLDAGNAEIKGLADNGREVTFPHAFMQIPESKMGEIEERARRTNTAIPAAYMRINGIPYAIGNYAYSHGTFTPEQGTARYRKDYYGIFVGAVLGLLYQKGGEVALFAAHPPNAIHYLDDLADAAGGHYEVAIGDKTLNFHVHYVNTFDEPLGGYCNVYMGPTGLTEARPDIGQGRTLVVDLGGYTCDFLAIAPGGEVDHGVTDSVRVGINDILSQLKQGLYSKYAKRLKSAHDLRRDDLQTAMVRREFPAAGDWLPCGGLVDEAVNLLLNRFRPAYHDGAGGPVPYQAVILTGGGSMMLRDFLLPLLDHKNVIMAESEEEAVHLANVRGGLKLWRFYESHGMLA